MDPAPADIHPSMTADQAVAAAGRGGQSGPPITTNADTVARFGLFTGNVVNVGHDANHTLQGSTRMTGLAAWVVMTTNVESTPYGPAHSSCPIPPGAAVAVIRDADGDLLANMTGGGYEALM
jgi:hypothetical protein